MSKRLVIHFGEKATQFESCDEQLTLKLNIPLLAGESQESYHIDEAVIRDQGAFSLIEGSQQLFGVCVVPVRFPLQETIFNAYHELLEHTKEWNIHRIWNFVPYINQETDGLENYKSFSTGRSLAYEQRFGEAFHPVLPAASAVGVNDTTFALYFVAGRHPFKHVENPEQVSAFHYPENYGPRAPSFARGTRVEMGDAIHAYVSGTAAIKGHQSLSVEDPSKQHEITFDNLKLVFREMGLEGIPPTTGGEHRYKVYIRNRDQAQSLIALCQDQFGDQASVSYLLADICRSDLLIEIEGAVFTPN